MPALDKERMLLGWSAAASPITKKVALMPFFSSILRMAETLEVESQSSKVSATTLADVLTLVISCEELAETFAETKTDPNMNISENARAALVLLNLLYILLT